ncbi:mannitol dehydrogenase family protein [Jannaschia seohaensis]|uniref:Mannitol 2-dehydrogenase n=1 Tax=Jannaschia seohaensis TaxID=475081 RepID=A0A2Y9A4B2_9RHOB|nr:mannitol dehydrogenase family protein [Jannaschia seohaensis]PWJ22448.1 mannitol 2-dehydrogenase [Jannaschia seohaensis]SSA38726.1 mannitol 2-dehydrogenase [Jannaschia seohaensis]
MDELKSENAVPLRQATLRDLPSSVEVPRYDRSALTPGIVHIGLGNFHRAHQAWYLHRLMQQGLALDWAIIGAGVRPADAAMRDRLAAQDYLTTLIELDPAGSATEVVGSMIGYVPIEEGNGALIEQMADPAIRIVSMTVTEGGYYLNTGTNAFDVQHPDIVHDATNPDRPRTAFGAIVAALRQRRADGTGPFTLQCCDNLQGNGDVMRQTVVGLARLSDPDLASWIDESCSFPNAMVDCIVPATGDAERELVRSIGVGDAAPVTHENFRQWVIEDKFCAGRPPWEEVGVTITDLVHDYETMKLRILNGGHQLIGNPGELLSVRTISDCMSDPEIGAFFRKVASTEIVPHVHPVPGMTPLEYVDLIDRRFSNPRIVDTTRRVAFDGSSKRASQLHGSLRDGLAAGTPIDGLALADAMWARMCLGKREDGSEIAPNDPNWDTLTVAAQAAVDDPGAWLSQRGIYGDLADAPRFAEAFAAQMARIDTVGVRGALRAYLDG